MDWTNALAEPLRDTSTDVSRAVGQDAVEQEFVEFVRKHRERVYRIAIQMMRRHEDADDVVQEAFLKAYRSLGRFQGAASIETWLVRIVMNVALNQLRHRERSQKFLSLFKWDARRTAAAPDAAVEANEARRAVHEAIDTLPAAQRAVVVLFDLEGMSCAEVAESLNIPEGTVRSRLHHARRHLKARLTPYVLGAERREGGAKCS